MKITESLKSKKSVELYLKRGLKDKDLHLRLLSLLPLILCYILTFYSFPKLNPVIPLWYTRIWGEAILTTKINIFVIPVFSSLFTLAAFVLAYFSKKFYFTFLSQLLYTGCIVFNTISLLNLTSLVSVASQTPASVLQIPKQTQNLLAFLGLGFLSSYFILPRFSVWAFKKGLVTDPKQHKHPGMILAKPSARGGGFIFNCIFSLISLLLLERTPVVTGIAVSVLVCGIIGILDDYQNISLKSKFKVLESPFFRLLILLPIPVIIMMFFGVVAGYINNPFDGNISLVSFSLNVLGKIITPLPYLFTLFWTLVIMNMISWSNGVDGQFGGVVGISMLIIGILALRLVEAEPDQLNTAKMAFLASGISFGFIKQTWHPSKIMWGFGAISVGLLLSSLSIVSRAKVATSIMVIMIPFLDGFITIVRRLLQKKNPLKGDRGHLHHLLLERGWSPQRVAIFYWIATAFFGLIGLVSAEKSAALITLTLGGAVASAIIFLNVSSQIGKRKSKESEAEPRQQQLAE